MERSGIQDPYLNIIKAIYGKQTANIKLNGEILEAIFLKLGIRQGCPLAPHLFNIVVVVLARTIRQQKEIQGIQINKEKNKGITICRWYNSVHKWSQKLYLRTSPADNQLQQIARYKINTNKSVVFPYTNDKQAEKEIRETTPFTIATNNIEYLGVTLTKQVKDLYSNTTFLNYVNYSSFQWNVILTKANKHWSIPLWISSDIK